MNSNAGTEHTRLEAKGIEVLLQGVNSELFVIAWLFVLHTNLTTSLTLALTTNLANNQNIVNATQTNRQRRRYYLSTPCHEATMTVWVARELTLDGAPN
jgi:hypothetical protein